MRRPLYLAAFFLALGTAPLAHADDAPISAEAKLHFQAGVNLLKDPDGARYEEAYREFRAAYSASSSYKVLGNLALCAMKLERDGEAVEAYQKYLEHAAELDPAEVKQIQTDLATLTAGLVNVTLNIDQPGASITDSRLPTRGDRITNLYGPFADKTAKIGMRAGHHTLIIKVAGYDDFTDEFDAHSGVAITTEIKLKKAGTSPAGGPGRGGTEPDVGRESKPGLPTGFYVGAAATGVLGASAAVVGIMALKNKSDFTEQNNGFAVQNVEDLRDKGKTLNLVTDILLGGTVVAAGVTTFFLVTRPKATKVGLMVVPAISTQAGGVVVAAPWF
jgi:hypothetical protein